MQYCTTMSQQMLITLPEEVDHHCALQIRDEADALIRSRDIRQVIFDFRETRFMDSSGIGVIMGRYRLVRPFGGSVIAIHVNHRINKIMYLSGIGKVIQISGEDEE